MRFGSKKLMFVVPVVLCVMGVLGACDDDGGSGGQVLDVSGYWFGYMTIAPDPETASGYNYYDQTGTSVTMCFGDIVQTGTVDAASLTASGARVDAPAYVFDSSLTLTGTDEMTGTTTLYNTGVEQWTATARSVRQVPQGDFAIDGTLGVHTLAIDETIGAWGKISGSGSVADGVAVYYVASGISIRFNIWEPADVAVGTFSVVQTVTGANQLKVEVTVLTPSEYERSGAESGTIDISVFDSGGFTFTFTDLSFNTGADTLSGSFDVTWDCLDGTPF